MSDPAATGQADEGMPQPPEGWQVKRLKYLAGVQTGMAKGKDLAGQDTVEVPYLRVANVQDGYLDLAHMATMAVPLADLDRYRLQPGHVLMNEGGDFDKLGRGHVWHGQIDPCIHQNHVFAVRPVAVSADWLNAYTGSAPAQFYFMGRSKQSTNLASISSSNLMELPVVMPPDAVQRRLLAYIDRETTRIDALIEKKTRFIELLREKRQALITQAVSGWPKRPLKFASNLLTSGPRGWSELIADGASSVFVQSGDLNDEMSLVLESAARINAPDDAEAARTRLRAGDVVVCITGANTGRVALATETAAPTYINQHLCLIRPSQATLNSAYLALVLHSGVGRDYFDCRQYGLKEGLNLSDVGDTQIPTPPMKDQLRIVETCAVQASTIQRLVGAATCSINLLKERRAALITAAVTGQIDVREPA